MLHASVNMLKHLHTHELTHTHMNSHAHTQVCQPFSRVCELALDSFVSHAKQLSAVGVYCVQHSGFQIRLAQLDHQHNANSGSQGFFRKSSSVHGRLSSSAETVSSPHSDLLLHCVMANLHTIEKHFIQWPCSSTAYSTPSCFSPCQIKLCVVCWVSVCFLARPFCFLAYVPKK